MVLTRFLALRLRCVVRSPQDLTRSTRITRITRNTRATTRMRTRARNHEKHKRPIDPCRPFTLKEQRRHNENPYGQNKNDRRVIPGKAIDKSLSGSLLLLSVFNESDDLSNLGVFINLGYDNI